MLSLCQDVVILGDTNFECNTDNEGYRSCQSLLCSYNVHYCDDYIVDEQPVTYRNDALGHSSFIDHMFVSDSVRSYIVSGYIYDSGVNFSDYLPLVYIYKLELSHVSINSKDVKNMHKKPYSWRWDKADLANYYHNTDYYLQRISSTRM